MTHKRAWQFDEPLDVEAFVDALREHDPPITGKLIKFTQNGTRWDASFVRDGIYLTHTGSVAAARKWLEGKLALKES